MSSSSQVLDVREQTTAPPQPARSAWLAFYRQMQLIRLTEERFVRSHQRGLIHGACHTYIGQEAIAAGVGAHLRPDDVVFSTHRGHGHALAKGLEPHRLFAELYGRETGCSRGRGGSMHLFAPEIGLLGTSGIVGPCILQAAGAGCSFQVLKTDQVAVAFFGDGAVSNGAFHEGLNLASLWKLPVLFVCENNQYATEIAFADATANPSVANRGAAYGLPGVEVDGNDVLAVAAAACEAVERARSGGGPTLLECKTYRIRAHAEGMGDFTYRTREEVEHWKTQCPIAKLKQQVLEDRSGCRRLNWRPSTRRSPRWWRRRINSPKAAPIRPPNPPPSTFMPPARRRPGGAMFRWFRAKPRELTFMKATLEALTEEMAKNPKILVFGEGIGERGGNFATTTGLFARYGARRLRDTPICERGFVGLAGGAAMSGTRPVVDFMFADFVLDAAGEIINQIAKMHYMSSGRLKMPVLLRGCIGIGHSAATHHSGSYYSMYAQLPRPARRRAVLTAGCQGSAQDRPHVRRSGALPRTPRVARPERPRARGGIFH